MSSFIIADDHPMTLLGTRSFVEALGHQVLATADNGITALNHLMTLRPAMAILDVNMPGLDGIDLLEAIQDKGLPTKAILLTMHREMSLYSRAKELNVWGYVLKDMSGKELQHCIDSVIRGEHYVSPGLASELIPDTTTIQGPLSLLTLTERKVLELVAQQKTSTQIGELLFISEKTVEGHRSRIIEKLELPKEKNSLLKWAIRNMGDANE
ncbi:MAG: response regulator transcription factor [Flavobacteriales bacterium]|nr:response regulator transcription factor [Flavobacteriales bacterium]